MREIRFRFWNKEEKKMYYQVPILAVMFYSENKPRTWSLDNVELMQYTGLKDKNGKEIYEGDIVEYDKESYPIENMGEIIFRKEHVKFCVKIKGHNFDNYFYQDFSAFHDGNKTVFEVIGNRYENPELLNEI